MKQNYFIYIILIATCVSNQAQIPTVKIASQCLELNCASECPPWDNSCSDGITYFNKCFFSNQTCLQAYQNFTSINDSDPVPQQMIQCIQYCNLNTSISQFYNFQIKNCQIGCLSVGQPQTIDKAFVSINTYNISVNNSCGACNTIRCAKALYNYNQCMQQIGQCGLAQQNMQQLNQWSQYPFSMLTCNQTCKPLNNINNNELINLLNCWNNTLWNPLTKNNCKKTDSCNQNCAQYQLCTTQQCQQDVINFNQCLGQLPICEQANDQINQCSTSSYYPYSAVDCYTICGQNTQSAEFQQFLKCLNGCVTN